MRLKMGCKTVMFRAIESMWYEPADNDSHYFVLRTVSGEELKKPVDSKEACDALIERLIEGISISEAM